MFALIAAVLSCSTIIFTTHPPATVHGGPQGPTVGTIRNGTLISIDAVTHDWLHIRAPKLGWVATSTTFVNCGPSTNIQDIRNLRNLALQGRHDRIAMNTFVRFFADHGGKREGVMQEEDAVDDFVDAMKFAPAQLSDALDQFSEQERKKMLTLAANRGDDIEEAAPAFIQFMAIQPLRPTASTWRSIMQHRDAPLP